MGYLNIQQQKPLKFSTVNIKLLNIIINAIV